MVARGSCHAASIVSPMSLDCIPREPLGRGTKRAAYPIAGNVKIRNIDAGHRSTGMDDHKESASVSIHWSYLEGTKRHPLIIPLRFNLLVHDIAQAVDHHCLHGSLLACL